MDKEWITDIRFILQAIRKPVRDNVRLPEVKEEHIHLYIYNQKTKNEAKILPFGVEYYNKNYSTKVIIPGWAEFTNKSWVIKMKDVYLNKGGYNVIVVDWQHYAENFYNVAIRQMEAVGDIVIKNLLGLIKSQNIDLKSMHLLGHSLGAHLAGYIGRALEKETSFKVGRITGLDAAGPLFETVPLFRKKRLAASDADFVDAIHTSSPMLGLGYYGPYGTADFYVNGGSRQPGCGRLDFTQGQLMLYKRMYDIFACDHKRSREYWIESINTENFKARNNQNEITIMGENCPSTAKGIYIVDTNSEPPFAKG